MIDRRQALAGATLATLLGGTATAKSQGGSFGMVGKIKAKPGERGALAALMQAGTGAMPGCLHYFVAVDVSDDDALWVFEVWTDRAAHDASLALPAVKETIRQARPLIAGFDTGAELQMLSDAGRAG